MKLLVRTMVLGLVLLVALAACGSSESSEGPKRTTASDLIASAGERPEPEGMYPAQDLSLVANTGRPQLLNGYANW